jgi:hypothetical protein
MSETQLHRVDGMGTTGPPKSTDVNCSVLRELHRRAVQARCGFFVATPALVAPYSVTRGRPHPVP